MESIYQMRKRILNEATEDPKSPPDDGLSEDDFSLGDPDEGDPSDQTEDPIEPEDDSMENTGPDDMPSEEESPNDDPTDGDDPPEEPQTEDDPEPEPEEPETEDNIHKEILKLSELDRSKINLDLAEKFQSLDTTMGSIHRVITDEMMVISDEVEMETLNKLLNKCEKTKENLSSYFTLKFIVNSFEENFKFYGFITAEISIIIKEIKDFKENR